MESAKKKIWNRIAAYLFFTSWEILEIIVTRRILFSGLLSCIILRLYRDKTFYGCRFSLNFGAYYLEEIWTFRIDAHDRTSSERYDNRWNALIQRVKRSAYRKATFHAISEKVEIAMKLRWNCDGVSLITSCRKRDF